MIRHFGQRVPNACYSSGTAVRFGDHVFYSAGTTIILAQVIGATSGRVQIQERGNPAFNRVVPTAALRLDAQAVTR